MTKDQLLKLPLWQYTGEQFLELLDSHFVKTTTATENVTSEREFGIRNTIKKLNRQLEKAADSFGNITDI